MVYLEPPPQLLQLLHESLPPSNNNTNNDDDSEVLAYIATLASSLSTFEPSEWIELFTPYLSTLPSFSHANNNGTATNNDNDNNDECTQTIQTFLAKVQSASTHHEESSDEEDAFGGEQITDIRFSLAYGGKILLHQTKLRLRRGHVYALVGQNGVGKTSELIIIFCIVFDMLMMLLSCLCLLLVCAWTCLIIYIHNVHPMLYDVSFCLGETAYFYVSQQSC